MAALAIMLAMAATLPSTGDVRRATYIGANGGICGEQACKRDPNIARVRHVRCAVAPDSNRSERAAACAYLIRTSANARWERANDIFYRDPTTGRWYLDDEDDDDVQDKKVR